MCSCRAGRRCAINRDVQLEIEGYLLERLLQRALARGAEFARIRRVGARKMCVSADETSAAILIEMCRRYGLNCREISRGGRFALREWIKKRWTLLPGMLLGLTLCAVFLSRLWWVDIVFTGPGAGMGSAAEMRRCIRSAGIHPGMPASALDTGVLQKKLMASAGDFSYIGVRRQGVRLLVEAAPELPAPELYQRGYARDLVAARDGVVLSVNAKSGTACVKPGDTVRAGQTLIRGEEAVAKDGETGEEITTGVSALGEVNARCWYEGSAEGYLLERKLRRTGNARASCRLRLMDFSLNILESEAFAREECETEILPVVGLYLPLEIVRSTHYETVLEERNVDSSELRARLASLARADALAKMSRDGVEAQKILCWEDCAQEGNTLRVRAVYEICTDIATTRDALTEEVYATWNIWNWKESAPS